MLRDVSTEFDELKNAQVLDKGEAPVRVDVLEPRVMEARMTLVKAAEITDSLSSNGRMANDGPLPRFVF